VIKVDDLTVVV